MSEPSAADRAASVAAAGSAFTRSLAGWGVPGATLAAAGGEPLGDDAFARELGRAIQHKLVGVFAGAVGAGDVAVTEQQFQILAAHHEEAMQVAIELEQLAVRVCDVLAGVGADPLVLKGSALAHTVALLPEHRTYGDVDVLVRSRDVDAAVQRLARAGCQRRVPELRMGFDRRFAKSVSTVWAGREVDLHRTLAPGPYGLTMVEQDMHEESVTFSVGGHRLRTFPPELHLVHGCYHAMLGDVSPALGSLRDIALLLHTDGLDEDRVIDLADRWGGTAVVAKGIRQTVEILACAATPLAQWASEQKVGRRDRTLMRAYQTQDRRFRRTATASLVALPTWRDRYEFLLSVTRPSDEHRQARG